ncbi:hypothetical protein [Desulfonatronospira sp.]|uniref:hypothetical protein n=1 Tax=Desulfonatronospira sp. TaxID=1962951 RepID=UPI0025C362A3|nr:hypothetical protein [Desulfonatronospira sp.]
MDITGISSLGGLANIMSKQEFGAQVVSKTLDYMNSSTLKSSDSGMSQAYDFNISVLGAELDGKQKMTDLISIHSGKGKLTNFNI